MLVVARLTLPEAAMLPVVLGLVALSTAAGPKLDLYGDPLPDGAVARLGTSRMWFPRYDAVTPLPPDYTTFLAVTPWETRRYDLATGRPVPGPALPFDRLLAVSADGKRAVGLHWPTLGVYPTAGGDTVWTAEYKGLWPAAALSADGRVLAVAEVSREDFRVAVVVRDVGENKVVARIDPGLTRGAVVDLSPDGKWVAVRSDSGVSDGKPPPFRVWEVATGKERFAVPGEVSVARFSPDGATLAVAAERGFVDLWDVRAGTRFRRIQGRDWQGHTVAFSPDGKTVAAIGRGLVVERWRVADGEPLGAADPPGAFDNPIPRGVGFAADGRLLAWGNEGEVTAVWDVGARRPVAPRGEHFGPVVSAGFAAGGREVVTSARDGRLVRWEAATGRPLVPARVKPLRLQFVTRFGEPLLLSADGTRGVSFDRHAGLYDLAGGDEPDILPPPPDPSGKGGLFPPRPVPVPSADFTRLAYLLVTTGETGGAACDLWDLPARRKLRSWTFPGIGGQGAAGFNRGLTRLVTATALPDPTGMVGLSVTGWDLTTGRKVGEVKDRPKGVRVAAVGESSAVLTSREKVWAVDLEAGTIGDEIDTFPPEPAGFSAIDGPPPVAFGPDDRWFAYGSPTGRPGEYGVTVRDWPRGKVLRRFAGHAGPVTSLTVSPDGRTLASGSADSSVLLWDISNLGAKK